jgi:hypothetical protein
MELLLHSTIWRLSILICTLPNYIISNFTWPQKFHRFDVLKFYHCSDRIWVKLSAVKSGRNLREFSKVRVAFYLILDLLFYPEGRGNIFVVTGIQIFTRLHGVTFQEKLLFIVTAVRN